MKTVACKLTLAAEVMDLQLVKSLRRCRKNAD